MRGPLCIKGSARHVNVLRVRLTSSSKPFPRRDVREKMYSYYKNTKTELHDCPHTFSPILMADLSSSQYANEQTLCFSSSTGSSSVWWPFCAKAVSNWFQASSFGLLLLLLLERSLGNNGAPARGVRGAWVRPSCPYPGTPCKLAGRKPEYSP